MPLSVYAVPALGESIGEIEAWKVFLPVQNHDETSSALLHDGGCLEATQPIRRIEI